jgi:type IV secretion system protein VirD4
MSLLIFAGSNFTAFGQENSQNKPQKSALGQLLSDSVPRPEETPKPTPEAKKTTREQKVEESNTSSTRESVLSNSSEEDSSTNDYLKAAEQTARELNAEARRQEIEAEREKKEIQRQQKAFDKQEQQRQSQLLQQQRDVENAAAEQRGQNDIIARQQQKAEQKIAQEETKWLWFLALLEILQMVGLAAIVFKKNIAKKSAIAMIIGLVLCLSALLLFTFRDVTLFESNTAQDGADFGAVSIFVRLMIFIGILAFIIGKISTYTIVSLIPKSLPAKLLSVFGVGLSLIALYSLTGYSTYGALCGLAVIIGGTIAASAKAGNGGKDNLHGSARFADRKDFKEFENPPETGAFILAPAHPDGQHGKIALPRSLSIMHGLILGGSGTGKSRGFFMPNCAEVENTSLVVTDPKSELWKFTSGFHNKAIRFAPTEPEASQCFNWIPLCTDARMSELCARALMTAGNTGNTDQFWIDAETAFLSAIFSHTATTKYPTPLTAYRLFTRQKPEELMQQLLHSPSYVAREQAIVFEQTDARIKGAIVPAIASRLQFMRDPSLQLFTSASLEAPNFGQLRRTPTAVYWCLREQDIARLRPLTSLFFTVLLEQIAGEEIPEGETSVPITAMLDEFANIGKIPDFEITQSLARGRGVALWLGIQSLSQLNQTYGNYAAQTIMSNCTTKIALHGLDYQTAEYVSKSLGEQTVSHSSSSFNFSLTGGSIGSHAAKHRRPLLTPDEVMRIGENEAIARTSNKYPMRLYKGYYDAAAKTYPVTPSLTKVYVEETAAAEDLAL